MSALLLADLTTILLTSQIKINNKVQIKQRNKEIEEIKKILTSLNFD